MLLLNRYGTFKALYRNQCKFPTKRRFGYCTRYSKDYKQLVLLLSMSMADVATTVQ